MKKTVSTILLIAIFFSIAAVPAYAEEYSSQTEYTKAKDFVANINFDFFFSSSDLGEDVIADLKNIQDYITSHRDYTMDDLCDLVEPAKTRVNANHATKYDYSSLLPTSKDVLNAKEKEVFNSNPYTDYLYYCRHLTLIAKRRGGSVQTLGQPMAMPFVMHFGTHWELNSQANRI